ncbi:MAG: undecaprenyldiphospho-muramoylpentapeptide beta-N-acetylglucosaminyltransferase [Candidatus Omnitrophica bacterium]|nr:undecaprenyldiphospho-muramoylpentapeptide beta-N-acetylglucosaminyltransferase [Candidatus Omnitrophota bacterium]
MKIILAAGGSGGHIFPAVALASELEKAGVNDIYFVSSQRRLDRDILQDRAAKCFFLSINPMPLKFAPLKYPQFIRKLLADMAASIRIIRKTRPDAVVGFGGYSSGAIVIAAKLFRIPIILHEQNLIPGRANRSLSRFADRVAVSFEGTFEHLKNAKEKIVYSGNPLRREILGTARVDAARRLEINAEDLTVLIMGGSQGSSFLNETASKAAMRVMENFAGNVQFIHLTGREDYSIVKDFYKNNEIPGKVFSFLERIDDAYAASDLAISRAGAAAIFELAFYAKPMILVPYPNPKNNQRSNAVFFSEAGAAIYKDEKNFSESDLAGEIIWMLSNPSLRDKISEAALSLSVPDASKRLADAVIELVEEKRSRIT